MPGTVLSPRLQHLLIHEDRKTGELVLPSGPLNAPRMAGSPPLSPPPSGSVAGDKKWPSSKDNLLPPIVSCGDDRARRPSTGLFSLLNDLSVASPPSTASSAGSSGLQQIHSHRSPQPPFSIRPPTPQSAPLPSSHDRPYFALHEHRHSVVAPTQSYLRPELLRRHSSHPYEYPQHQLQYRPSSSENSNSVAYATITGSRAPISRTTKACNACRGRKVRCDAGGLPNGETSTCSRCRESGVECIYTGVQKKRGPCPGSARPVATNNGGPVRTRRLSSHRSSFASVSYPTTPPDEYPQWNSRSSYGFGYQGPPPHTMREGVQPQYYPTPPYHQHPGQSPYHSQPPYPQYPPPRDSRSSSSQWSSNEPPPLRNDQSMKAPTRPGTSDRDPRSNPSRQPSVLSWPQMEPALEVDSRQRDHRDMREMDESRRVFDQGYTMRPISRGVPQGRSAGVENGIVAEKGMSLPPLRIAISGRDSYYSP